jgi:hypothetical protein
MNHAYEYLPPIIEGEPRDQPFETEHELLEISWVARWRRDNWTQFSVTGPIDLQRGSYMIVAEYEDDTTAFVGFVDSLDGLYFPKYEPTRR